MTSVSIRPNAPSFGSQAYLPSPLNISPGTTVTWTNNDTMAHTVTSTQGIFNSGVIQPGQTYSFKFTTPGTYNYFCTIHGAAAMNGIVNVSGTPMGAASSGVTSTGVASPGVASPGVVVPVVVTPGVVTSSDVTTEGVNPGWNSGWSSWSGILLLGFIILIIVIIVLLWLYNKSKM
jgi:hypothetical protein